MNYCYEPSSCMRAKSLQWCMTASLWTASLLCPRDWPGKNTGNTGVSCPALHQGTFPNQGWNPHLFASPELAGRFFTASATWEARCTVGDNKRNKILVLAFGEFMDAGKKRSLNKSLSPSPPCPLPLYYKIGRISSP